MIYLLTGWPGAGKSTVAVQHAIYRYACNGRRVVANFPIDFGPACIRRGSRLSNASVHVIPDRPTRADLDSLGFGGEREDVAGMLIVDEAGGWLNARTWQGGEREAIIDWLTQSRKRMWDVYLIAQAAAMLDKQVREAICEGVVRIRRFDRFKVLGVSMPRVHIAIVRYGLDHNAPVLERWFYRGTEAQQCFGSYRVFGAEDFHYSVLPARLVKWQQQDVRTLNAFGKQFIAGGAVLCALMSLVSAALGCGLLVVAVLLARLWGTDVRKSIWGTWANRFRRYGGMGAVAPHAKPGRAADTVVQFPRGGGTAFASPIAERG